MQLWGICNRTELIGIGVKIGLNAPYPFYHLAFVNKLNVVLNMTLELFNTIIGLVLHQSDNVQILGTCSNLVSAKNAISKNLQSRTIKFGLVDSCICM